MVNVSDNPELLDQIQLEIALGNFRAAMEYLNQTGPYRFTALYRMAGDNLQNAVVYDRVTQSFPRLGTIPLGESYCLYVRDLRDAFIVADSDTDGRVADHPKRQTVHAYCGVPITDLAGNIFGTLCHFDYDPVPDDERSVRWLEAVADLFNPAATIRALARGIEPKMDSLAATARLFREAGLDEDEANAAYEEYVQPILRLIDGFPEETKAPIRARIERIRKELAVPGQ